jgi:hypothetical protein
MAICVRQVGQNAMLHMDLKAGRYRLLCRYVTYRYVT